jgi:hypothetical protein
MQLRSPSAEKLAQEIGLRHRLDAELLLDRAVPGGAKSRMVPESGEGSPEIPRKNRHLVVALAMPQDGRRRKSRMTEASITRTAYATITSPLHKRGAPGNPDHADYDAQYSITFLVNWYREIRADSGQPAGWRPDWAILGRCPYLLETSLPGVFAVGDVRASSVKRVAAAVGEGSMAVRFAQQYLGQLT